MLEAYVMVFGTLMLLVGIAGFLGNLVVTLVYLCDKGQRSFTHFLFVNLSVIDMLIVALCLPVALHDLFNRGEWALGEFACASEMYAECTLVSASSLTLVAISVERYIAISRPFDIRKLLNRKMTIGILLVVWLSSLLSSLPVLNYAKLRTDFDNTTNRTITYCYNDRDVNSSKQLYLAGFILVFIFMPTIVLSGVYIVIVRKLRRLNQRRSIHELAIRESMRVSFAADAILYDAHRSARRRRSTLLEVMRMARTKRSDSSMSTGSRLSQCGGLGLISKRKQTITLCLVALTFFLCQIPVKIFQLYNNFYEFNVAEQDQSEQMAAFVKIDIIFLSTRLLFYLHSMSNPIIYNLMSSKFSTAFRNIILCRNVDCLLSTADCVERQRAARSMKAVASYRQSIQLAQQRDRPSHHLLSKIEILN